MIASWASQRLRDLLVGLALVPALVVPAGLVASPEGVRLSVALAVSMLFLGLGLIAPRLLLYLVFSWLVALGLIRRLLTEVSAPVEADVLLLVGPAALAVLLMAARASGAFEGRMKLANAVLLLSVFLVVGSLNPLQGGPLSGAAGLLFLLVPTLWFWVGRGLSDDRAVAVIVKLAALLGAFVALYGLYQTFVGFPSWDVAWIDRFGYAALDAGEIRAFANFSAASEYAAFLGIAIVCWVALGLGRRWTPLALAVVALLSVALLYEASRGVVFTTVLALGLMTAARSRMPLALGMALAAIFVLSVPFAASRLAPTIYGADPESSLVRHQVEGLAEPLDSSSSTLPGHLGLMEEGLRSAISNPLGIGVAPVTIAGGKFGDVTRGTETDPSNIATAIGIPGLVAYLIVLVLGLCRAYAVAHRRRDGLSAAALGILLVTLLQWLNGAHYAVATLPWLVLGWIDRVDEPTAEEARSLPRPAAAHEGER